MHPIGAQIVNQINHRADSPGKGICPVDITDFTGEAHNYNNVKNTHHTPDRKHHAHRHKSFSRPPAHSRNGMGKGQQTVKQRNGAGLLHPKGNNAGRLVKKSDESGGKNKIADTDCLRQEHRRKNAKNIILYAFKFFKFFKIKCIFLRKKTFFINFINYHFLSYYL